MKRRRLVSLLGGTALAPLAAAPAATSARAEPADRCAVPPVRGDGWLAATADDYARIDRAALCRMADRLAASSEVHSVVVARSGRLAFERYFSGPDEVFSRRVRDVIFDADTLHDMKSVSKSVVSLLVGIALEQGLIRSVDQPILDFFPELSDMRSTERDRLLLSHALTMSMGLRWIEAAPDTEGDNDEDRMRRAADPCRYVLGLPATAPPGQEFFYNTGTLALVSAIMRKATGRPLDEFARTTLFEPLGIERWEWKRYRGDSDAGGGLRLRPRDMAKIGQLVLGGGSWNGRQVVPRAWLDASMVPRFKASNTYDYGYLWWLGHASYNGREDRWDAALGRGGQSIRIVPGLDLVIAVTAGYYQDYSERAFQLQRDIFRDILRAVSA